MTFTLHGKTPLADKNTHALVFEHPSGMRHIHIPSDFPELSFVISVPTPTDDSTGMSHILEHMVMSGSKNYTQESPFFSMNGKTVAHEMNASTDRAVTSYHFATTDRKDYENLCHLYLDLTLHPLLRKEDFNREAWRIEIDDGGSPKLNGVVLNEMLGVYSDPSRHRYEALVAIVGSGTPSEFLTGGHPLSIPAVDYETLKSFYSSRYFFGNMVVVTTGDIQPSIIQEWIEKSISSLPQDVPSHLLSNGKAEGKGANPHQILETTRLGQVNSGEILGLGVPQQEGQTPKAVWVWKTDYLSGSLNELRDQLIVEALFSDANPAFIALRKELKRPVTGSLLFHPTARMGGNIGLVIEMNAAHQDELEQLDEAVRTFLDRSAKEGLNASGWVHSLDSLIGSQRQRTPLHDVALSIGGLALEGLPLDCDMNNLKAAKDLKAEGVPSPEELGNWFKRWQGKGILFSYPRPTLMDEWRQVLADMAVQKIELGVVPTDRIQPDNAESNDTLPRIRTKDLNPVFDKMADTFDIPATPFEEGTARPDLTPGPTHRTEGKLIDPPQDPENRGKPHWPRHIHIASHPDERALSVSADFQVEHLDLESKVALSALPILQRRLGWNNQDFETSAQEARTNGVSCEIFVSSNDGAAEATHWTLGVKATPTDMDRPNEFLAQGVMASLNLNFGHHDDLTQAAAEAKGAVQSKIEELQRRREKVLAVASVDAAAARHRECSVGPELVLEFLVRTEENPEWGKQQLQEAVGKLHGASRRVMTIGDQHVSDQGRKLAQGLVSTATPWIGGNETPWRPEGSNTDIVHVFKPGGSHDVERHVVAVDLRDDTRKRLASQVAVNLLAPFLHEELREKGGAYGAGMTVKHHSIVLGSYRDPSPDAAYRTFDEVSGHLLDLVHEGNEDLLEEARVAVAGEIVSPGDGRMGLRDALNNVRLNLAMPPDFRAQELAELTLVSWEEIREVAHWLQPGARKSLDVTVGPSAPTPRAVRKNKTTP